MEFFKAIIGGRNDGLTFGKFIFKMDKILPLAVLILFNVLLWTYKYSLGASFWYAIGFIDITLGLFIYKTIQHWEELKK